MFRRCWLGLAAVAVLVTGVPGVASAADGPKLAVTAEFDKAGYQTGELIKATVTIKNVTAQRLDHVRAGGPSDNDTLKYDEDAQWGALLGDGISLDAGATKTVTITGYQPHALSTVVNLHVSASAGGPEWTDVTITAPITLRYAKVSGTAYGDQNNNNRMDPGEGMAGLAVAWWYERDINDRYEATTDSQGRFTFDKLPTVSYEASARPAAGWEIVHKVVTVDRDLDDVQVRVVHPLNGALKASLEFTGDGYNVGDTAHLTLSLQNTGTTDMAGIVSSCGPVGLTGTTPGWGDLAGDGVTIPAGTTKTLDVAEKVPDSARTWGYVAATCYFGYDRSQERTTHAVAHDSAPIKGVFADYKTEVRNFPCQKGTGCRGNPVPGVRVVLVNEGACPVAGEGVTDANGIVTIKHLVPGTEYLAYLYPQQADWTGLPNPAEVHVTVGGGGLLEVGPGGPRPAQPCGPTPPSDVTPDAQAKPPADELANTGVSVMGLTGLGALTLFAGAGVLAAARRRAR